MDDPGHASLRTKPFTASPGRRYRRRRQHRFFTPRERVVAVLLGLVFVGLAVLSVTGHVGG